MAYRLWVGEPVNFDLVQFDYLKMRLYALFVVLVLCLGAYPSVVKGQSYVEVFGQNRIQYRKFDWKFFDTKHFRVYHYDRAGRQLGRYVAEDAEKNISLIEKKLGGQFPHRFNIILYNSYDEYRQSNVGLKDESSVTGNTRAGTLNLVGDKLVVYFTGEHSDLQHQIRSGMARVVMERMIFGENFKKMVKNALLLNLPEWVTDGYIAYLVDGWDAKSNSEWKSLLDARPGAGFYELSDDYPELAGKAFWKFVSSQYSNNTVKNLLYSMQQKSSLNKAMKEKENLGLKVTKAYDSCIRFYKTTYALDARNQEKPDSTKGLIALKVPKDNSVLRNIRVSPRGSDVSYVAWKDGQYTVYTQKTSNEQQLATILEGGQKDLTEQTDPNYPMLAWSATGYKLAILYRKGFETRLRIYNSLKGKIENYIIPKNRFDRVLSMAFMQDDDKLVFSAIKKSQTDLYMFTIKGSKMTNITDDVWDDLSPVFVSGGSRTGILFLSNRPKPNMNVPLGVNELPTGPLNVFFYNTKTMSTELLQCTDVTTGHVTQPIQYGLDNFAYLYDSNGINNKFVVLFARNKRNKDSAYSVPITNYTTSIISQQYNLAVGDVADVIQEKDKYMVYFHELQMPGENATIKTLVPTTLSIEKPEPKTVPERTDLPQYGGRYHDEVDTTAQPEIKSGNAFQSEFSDTAAPKRKVKAKHNNIFNANAGNTASDSSMLGEITDSAYLKMKPTPYRLSFKPDAFSIKLDNSILFSQYQSIAGNGGSYNNPSLGALATLSLNELMENHRITGGFQLPINTSGSAYFLQYQNFTKRLDWGVTFLRFQDKKSIPVAYVDSSGRVAVVQDQLFKSVTNMLQGDLSYPLDRVRSIRFHTALRQDRLVEKTTDKLSLNYEVPSPTVYTTLSRLEYVFDNTISPGLNLLNGTRFKVYGEYLYALNNGNKSCYNLGLDFRNYTRLYKNIILANRVAYAHSDGTAEVEYLVGGVDNWIGPKQDANASQPPADNYGFQAMSTPMRGYKQYARIGNNFAVLNTEVRVPVITTFMRRPIQSAILKNLQLVGFMDIGAAWRGFIPDAEHMDNTYSYPTMPSPYGLNNVFLTLRVPNSGGVAMGYGAGLRTSLFGYFVRLDAAWNIEGIKTPIIYLALGTDF
jgi:Tol biopolymer transport system component